MAIWLTSDTHFSHFNIIKLCDRPFSSAEEMNAKIIKNWNEKVTPEDEVYHLGDFGNKEVYSNNCILDRLNGKKYLIQGNHDHKLVDNLYFRARWIWIKDYYEMWYQKQLFVMSHYPMLSWNGSCRNSIMTHGHEHGRFDLTWNNDVRRIDVGVDSNNFYPISLDEIIRRMEKK